MIARIGKYEIRSASGQGAFTTTFQAFDPDAARPVTVTVLAEVADKERLASFRKDAAAIANLQHKNIAAIYELGEHAGLPFVAMQHLQGGDLRELIASPGSLTLLQKMLLMSEVADALKAAHQGGLSHVGIRPSGIIRLDDGSVRVAEFGAVRVIRPGTNGHARPDEADVLYKSPEEITASSPPDLLSDIFVYGVVYYELLTGKHPFAAAASQGAAFKIANEDAAPLRSLVPDCPEPVEQIVYRLLQRDRELRYQCLDDAQCDAEPILQELKREHAQALLLWARQLLTEQQLDSAQTVVREALEFDPGNREGRRLRDTIRDQLQRLTTRSRLNALLERAEGEVTGRRFADAVQTLELALRLDRSDAAVQNRLRQARGLKERSEAAAALLSEARRLIEGHDLDEARSKASGALASDPENHEAKELLAAIQAEADRRKQDVQFDQELAKVKNLVLLESFEEAIAILLRLDATRPGTAQVAHWLEHARVQQSEKEIRDRLHNGLAAARSKLENHQFRSAVEQLESLRNQFPQEQEVIGLWAEAHGRLEAFERNRAVEKARAEALAFCEARDFASAIRVLEQALQSFPEEALQRALDEAVGRSAAYQREQRVAEVLEQVDRYRREWQFDAALEVADAALAATEGDETLLELRGLLDTEREEHLRATVVRQALQEAQWFMDQDRPDLAAQLLRESQTACPRDAELAGRLHLAEQALADWEKHRSIQDALARATALEQREQWRPALTVLQEAARSYPDAPDLIQAIERLQIQIRENDHQRKLARQLEMIGQKMAERAWGRARAMIDEARRDFPGEPELERLAVEACAEQERANHENLIVRIERCLADGELQQAGEILQAALARDPQETRLQALQKDLEKERAYQNQRQTAEVFYGRGEYREAEKLLLVLAARRPNSPELHALLEAARAGRAAADEKQFYDRGRVKALRLAEDRQLDQAADLLRNLLAVFPNDPILEKDLRSVLAAQYRQGDGNEAAPAGRQPAEQEAPTEPADSRQGPSGAAQSDSIAAPAQPRAAKPEPFQIVRAPLQIVVTSWQRPALITIVVLLAAASAILPFWKFSRSQHALASSPPVSTSDPAPVQVTRPERAGGRFQNPQLISGPGVVMPPLAQSRNIYGAVDLETTISKEGTVSKVAVVAGHPMLAEAARQAVLARRYHPATLNGAPVEVTVPIQIVFQPER